MKECKVGVYFEVHDHGMVAGLHLVDSECLEDPDVASIVADPFFDDVSPHSTQKDGSANGLADARILEPVYSRGRDFTVVPVCHNSLDDSAYVNPKSCETLQSELYLNYANFSKDDVLFTLPPTLEGSKVEVTLACAARVCDCIHLLGKAPNHLPPCRFAFMLFKDDNNQVDDNLLMFGGICDGFAVVDTEPRPYACDNYLSILTEDNKPKMDAIVSTELAEGFLGVTDESLGAYTPWGQF